jgi:hypothetical protein
VGVKKPRQVVDVTLREIKRVSSHRLSPRHDKLVIVRGLAGVASVETVTADSRDLKSGLIVSVRTAWVSVRFIAQLGFGYAQLFIAKT